ncbi:MAG: chemotaxis protein CheW [Deltaproteobacteria bacterium]|nr:chemotaxis protein CheW [Deltaproteobacteria bacterium]
MSDNANSSKNGTVIDRVKNRVDEIKSLENEVLNLKKEILLESAQTIDQNGDKNLNLSFLLLNAAGNKFAAPLKYIDEVVEIPELISLNNSIPSIAGMVNFHGELLAVIDLKALNSNSSTDINQTQMLIICTVEERKFALLIEEAIEVVTVAENNIKMSDSVMPGIIKNSGILQFKNSSPAVIIDLLWIAVGTQLAALVENDKITVAEPEKLK